MFRCTIFRMSNVEIRCSNIEKKKETLKIVLEISIDFFGTLNFHFTNILCVDEYLYVIYGFILV